MSTNRKAPKNSKKPTLRKFTEVVEKCGGNISSIARTFGVNRLTVYEWGKADPDSQAVIDDQRGKILDECISISRVLARGIPIYDEQGKIIGWTERPDSGMVRYLMSTLGRKEGFGENVDITTNGGSIAPAFKIEVIDRREQVITEETNS